MKRSARWAGLSSIVAASAFVASPLLAQEGVGMGSYANPVSFGVFAGASVPFGDFADFASTFHSHFDKQRENACIDAGR